MITKFIYGQTVNLKKRKYRHLLFLRKNKHHSQHLQNAYTLYGEISFIFEIIEETEKEKAKEREQFWMNFYNSFNKNFGFNICSLAGEYSYGQKGKNLNTNNKGENNPFYGKHHSDETKELLRKLGQERKIDFTDAQRKKMGWGKGLLKTDETKRKMGLSKKGEKSPMAKLTWDKVRDIRNLYKTRCIFLYKINENV